MQLKTNDLLYQVHFRYETDKQGRKLTLVRIHSGTCNKPCRFGVLGHALCSEADCFKKAVGRKLAMQRALRAWPKETRRRVWAAYWAVSKPQKAAVRPR